VLFALLHLNTEHEKPWLFSLMLGLYLPALFVVYAWILLSFALLAAAFDVYMCKWRNPIAYFLLPLFEMLIRISKESPEAGSWDPPDERRNFLTQIEVAAQCLEILRKRMPPQDPMIERKSKEAFHSRIAYLRGLKMWILIPQPVSRLNLTKELHRIVELAASGDWDGLPQATLDVEGKAEPSRWFRVLNVLRNLILALAPPIAVMALTVTRQLENVGPLREQIVLLSWIWALLNLLKLLDPNLNDRVQTFGTMASAFGKSKEK
jgi:hypothetical protein